MGPKHLYFNTWRRRAGVFWNVRVLIFGGQLLSMMGSSTHCLLAVWQVAGGMKNVTQMRLQTTNSLKWQVNSGTLKKTILFDNLYKHFNRLQSLPLGRDLEASGSQTWVCTRVTWKPWKPTVSGLVDPEWALEFPFWTTSQVMLWLSLLVWALDFEKQCLKE